ncbi:MAG: DUF3365 domain-containing protein [Desulfuromonadales bacterium]|nr:DUF3365 domain-containing protein [Desulfuromonadales bacterium]
MKVTPCRKYGLAMLLISFLLVLSVVVLIKYWHRQATVQEVLHEARSYYLLNVHYRSWNADLGGVYVPVDKVEPNPYMAHHPRRDVTLTDGTTLTLVNPAYMTRMVLQRVQADPHVTIESRLIGFQPINPENDPSGWEVAALHEMEKSRGDYVRVSRVDNRDLLHYLGPLLMDESCLDCHEAHGYHVGDLRGAISLTLPVDHAHTMNELVRQLAVVLLTLWSLFAVFWVRLSRKRCEQELALQESQAQMQLLLDSAAEAIVGIDMEGICRFCNRASLEILGMPDESQLIGAQLHDRIHDHGDDEPLAQKACPIFHSLISAERIHLEKLILRRMDGAPFTAELWSYPIVKQGQQVGAVVSFIDISDRLALEEQNLRSSQLASVGELAAGVAHEINNPITGVINYAQLLLNGTKVSLPPEEILKRIIKEGNRIASIVRALLHLSRDTHGELYDCHMAELLANALTLACAQLEKDGIVLDCQVAEDLRPLRANPQQIEQMIINLLHNTRYALNEKFGGKPLDGELPCLTICLETVELPGHQAGCRLTVHDNGTGIAAELLPRVTNPFVTTKPAGVGTGLGLSLCQEIATRHGGNLSIKSRQGAFTEVVITLPYSRGGKGKGAQTANAPAPAPESTN